jgi:hypothetical protein
MIVNEIWRVTSIIYNIKNATSKMYINFILFLLLKLKFIRCMDLIVYTSFYHFLSIKMKYGLLLRHLKKIITE